MLKRILRLLLLSVGYLTALIVPRREEKLLFHSQPDAVDNSWHLYCYLSSRLVGKHFVWLCERPAAARDRIRNQADLQKNRLAVVKIRSFRGLFHYCSARYLFFSHGVPSFFPVNSRCIKVNLWHGMPIKPIGFLHKELPTRFIPYDVVLSTSALFTPIMADAFGVLRDRVCEAGLPRNDALLQPNVGVSAVLADRLNISCETKLVFWLPTYRQSRVSYMPADSSDNSFLDEWSPGLLARLGEVATRTGSLLLIKLHPLDVLNDNPPSQDDFPGVRLVTAQQWGELGVDLYDALSMSHALITDLSSVLIDYVVTGRPIAVTSGSQGLYDRGFVAGARGILSVCFSIDDEVDFERFLEDPAVCSSDEKALLLYNRQAETRLSACREVSRRIGLEADI